MPPSKFRHVYDNLFHGQSYTVGFPLYRVLAFFCIPPAVLQIVLWRAPDSVTDNTPSWYDACFVILQLIGVILVLVALSLDDTFISAHIERLGVVFMGAVGVAYFISAWVDLAPQPPLTVASWMQLGFSYFCLIRWLQLGSKIDEWLEKVKKEECEKEGGCEND